MPRVLEKMSGAGAPLVQQMTAHCDLCHLCVCPAGGCTAQGKSASSSCECIPDTFIHNILQSSVIISFLGGCRYHLSNGCMWECVIGQF